MTRAILVLAAVAAVLAAASPAAAELRLKEFTTTASTDLAGAHPDVSTTFSFQDKEGQDGVVDGTLSDVRIDLPPGLLGNPNAVPACSQADFQQGACEAASRVGRADLIVQGLVQTELPDLPVFSLRPGRNEPALLGIALGLTNAYVRFTSRTDGDYGLTTILTNVPAGFPIVESKLTLWGVPADHNGGGGPRRPFMTNPTTCSPEIPVTKLRASSYENPDQFVTATSQAVVPPSTTPGPITGCDGVPFAPGLTVTPESTQADAPSAYAIDLTVPQNDDPDGRAASQLRGAKVTLPPGAGISPAAADGLELCSDEQLGFGNTAEVRCPDASKVGEVSFDVPVLPLPIEGDIHLGTPTAENPFRIFLVGRGSGLIVKLRGNVSPDPATGQLTTTFADNPQVPFSRFSLRFKGGPRAILANPRTCGPATTTSELTPWSGGPVATPTSTYDVTGCDNVAFTPAFSAGGASAVAGADTSFALTVDRDDGEPELSRIDVSMPPGLVGRLAAVPQCPAAVAASGGCDESSRVGTATIVSGSGSRPLTLTGRVHLAEPTAPGQVAALSIVTRAVAGPFDLGTVVVGAAIRLRPEDSGLDIVSEPLPTTVGGIPLRLRRVRIDVDRPGFMINPTSCDPLEVRGSVGSAQGDRVAVTSPFQVGGCDALPLRARLEARAGGAGRTRTGAHPIVTTTITQPPGDTNLARVAVTLPSNISVNFAQLRNTCEPADLARDACPAQSRLGTAMAETPVLPGALRGPVFLLASQAGLPRIALQLRGAISLDLIGDVVPDRRGRLVTTFPTIPDVPISLFRLQFEGSPDSPIVNTTSLCQTKKKAKPKRKGKKRRANRRRRRSSRSRRGRARGARAGQPKKLSARVTFVGQNGKRLDDTVPMAVDGCPRARRR